MHPGRHGPKRSSLKGEVPAGLLGWEPRTIEIPQRGLRERPAGGAPHEELLNETKVATLTTPQRDRRREVVEPDLVQGDQHLDAAMGSVGEPWEYGERTPIPHVENHGGVVVSGH